MSGGGAFYSGAGGGKPRSSWAPIRLWAVKTPTKQKKKKSQREEEEKYLFSTYRGKVPLPSRPTFGVVRRTSEFRESAVIKLGVAKDQFAIFDLSAYLLSCLPLVEDSTCSSCHSLILPKVIYSDDDNIFFTFFPHQWHRLCVVRDQYSGGGCFLRYPILIRRC